jgi:hypothetical protein
MNVRIGMAVATPTTVEAVQVVTRAMDLVLEGQHDASKDKPMNTSTGQRDEKLKGTCNWYEYKNHFERECRQKAIGRPRKVSLSNTPNTSHGLLKCFRYGRKGHHVTDCKAKVVFSAEESRSEANKSDSSYSKVYRREGIMDGLSEIRSVL